MPHLPVSCPVVPSTLTLPMTLTLPIVLHARPELFWYRARVENGVSP
jgi:hypothetical protein